MNKRRLMEIAGIISEDEDFMNYKDAVADIISGVAARSRTYDFSDVRFNSTRSDDFTGEGFGTAEFTIEMKPEDVSISYSIESDGSKRVEGRKFTVHLEIDAGVFGRNQYKETYSGPGEDFLIFLNKFISKSIKDIIDI